MSKDKVLLIGVDLGNEKDCQCATLNLYYNDTDHIIYQTTDKEQVEIFNEILEDVNKEKTKLQRLESIDNANPSEALECLERMWYDLPQYYEKEYNTIKQALLKSQEDEEENKRLWNDITTVSKQYTDLMLEYQEQDIIKEKRVDLSYLRCCIEDNQSVERYNEYIRNKTMDYDHEEELTEEEFELLKRWIK